MYFDLNYNCKDFVNITICPTEKEDPDLLYDYAQTLRLKNPAVTFTEMAKAGLFNDMDDDEYRRALEGIKVISQELFGSKSEQNVFHVLAEAVNYIVNHAAVQEDTVSSHDEGPSPDEEDEEEIWDDDELLDWDVIEEDDDDDDDA